MWFDLDLQICIFAIPIMKASAYAVRICKSQPDFFRMKNVATWAIRFLNKKMAWSLNAICMSSTTASSSITIDKLDGDTAG